jgi:hypothetical protein
LAHFSVPRFVSGDLNSLGEAFLVLDDVSVRGFRTFDSSLLHLDLQHLEVSRT